MTVSRFAEAARQRKAVEVMVEEHGNLPWIGASFNLRSEVDEAYYESYFDSFYRKVTGILVQEVDADELLLRLPRISSLRAFRIVDGYMTDRGVEALCHFDLTDVEINSGNASVSDAGLMSLAKIKTLRTINLLGGDWTDQGIANFKRQRPDVEVTESRIGRGDGMYYSR